MTRPTSLPIVAVLAALSTGACAPLLHNPGFGYPRPYAQRPAAVQQDIVTGRWDRVIALAPGATLAVMTTDGDVHVGRFVKAGLQWLSVAVDGAPRELARADVMRIDLVSAPVERGGGDEVMRGAAVGAATMGGAMMVVPFLATGDVWVPPARFWGFGAALGAIGAVQKRKLEARDRTVYLAPELRQ